LVFTTCKKEQKDFALEVSGTLKEGFSKQPVGSANVGLYVKEISGSIHSGMFRKIEETITDSEGNFKFSFNRGNSIEYRLDFNKEGYFSTEKDFDSNQLKPDLPYNTAVEIYTKSTIEVYLKRKNNNGQGYLRVNGRSQRSLECCASFTYFSTFETDTLIVKEIYGDQYFFISHILSSPSTDNIIVNDSVYCPAFQKVNYSIIYNF
jgi:hypothetical protein